MHMDDLLSETAPEPVTVMIRSRDLHTLCRVIIERRKDGLIIILPSF